MKAHFIFTSKYMTQQERIEKALQFTAIRSTADNKTGLHEAVNFIAAQLMVHPGITIERFESEGMPSLLAYYGTVRPSTFDVLLNGHVDVVPGKPEQFEPYVQENKLYGRGVYDMKMATLLMTEAFIESGNIPEHSIGLQIASDEEVGGYNGTAYQLRQGVQAKFVITGEMTNLGICNEARGLCWVEVAFHGKNAHGGYAWDGSNAIIKANKFINALLAKYPEPTEPQWLTTASVAQLTTTNKTYNIVPDDATVKIDFRFTKEDDHFKNVDSVKALIASLDAHAQITDIFVCDPAVSVDKSNPYLQALLKAYTRAAHKEASLVRRYAASDGRHFARYNVPSVEFGLSGAEHHGKNEHINLTSMAPFYDTLITFLQNLPKL